MKSQVVNVYHKLGGFKKFWATIFSFIAIFDALFIMFASPFIELHNAALIESIFYGSIGASGFFAGVCTYEAIKLGKKIPNKS
jgi:hypothetical protein